MSSLMEGIRMKNALESSKELARNKVILLYLIYRINMPVSNLQITKIILENRFMNYFLLQQFLNELCEAGYLKSENKDDKTFYSITDDGRLMLDYFKTLTPPGIKKAISDSITSIRNNIKNETLITAEIKPDFESGYMVKLSIHEDNFSLMDLYLAAGTRSDAANMCKNFKNNPQKIYENLLSMLRQENNH
jgi:predicted transcriptional regulator